MPRVLSIRLCTADTRLRQRQCILLIRFRFPFVESAVLSWFNIHSSCLYISKRFEARATLLSTCWFLGRPRLCKGIHLRYFLWTKSKVRTAWQKLTNRSNDTNLHNSGLRLGAPEGWAPPITNPHHHSTHPHVNSQYIWRTRYGSQKFLPKRAMVVPSWYFDSTSHAS